jgi:hypothetical protein
MVPIGSNTQITVPTQVSFVATALPGTSALRVAPDAVAPSVSNAALGPDYKGNGGYVSVPAAAATTSAIPAILSTLIPANLSTASATLSASAMFATQSLSQGAQAGSEFFAVYEELVAASQVKYKPSNATAPEPVPNNLFAKMLAETQTQNNVRVNVQAQQAPKEALAQAVPQNVIPEKLTPVATKQKTSEAAVASVARHASGVYQATSVRNHIELEAVEAVDTISG